MNLNRRHVGIVLVGLGSCSWLTGGAKKDEVEAAREAHRSPHPEIAAPADAVAAAPHIEIKEAALGSVGDSMAEGLVIVLFAAAISGLTRLARRHTAVFNLLLAAAAFLLAAVAFVNSAT